MQESEKMPEKVWRVLIVDDDPQLPYVLNRILIHGLKEKVVVELAADGTEGLAKVNATLDILFTDYQMPGMNGVELISRAREIAPGLKVVLMSGDDGAAKRLAEASKDGTIITMVKPFAYPDVMALMAQLMT